MEIEFINVSKKYKNRLALDRFSTTLTPGIYGLLGANGAGKTTLLNILVGVLPRSGGRILANGVGVEKLGNDFLKELGYLPQYPRFYRDFTVREFLAYMCALKDIPLHTAKRRTDELLRAVNMRNALDLKIGALSGGMRQRVGIVQALLGDPELLILDEPTAGLDPQERIRFRNLIARFAENRIVLLATHIVSDVDAIANEVLLLKEGRLIRRGTPEGLCEELNGKTWELTLTKDYPLFNDERPIVSRVQRSRSELRVRVLSDVRPFPDAVRVDASLEDVFLYHFASEKQPVEL